MRGFINHYKVAADVPFTTNIVPATVGLLSPLAAGEEQHFNAWIPITVTGAGGFRLLVVAPAGSTTKIMTLLVNNTVTPSEIGFIPVINVATTNAIADVATHWLNLTGTILNGAVAGSIDIQLAQNTSTANTLTVLKGGWMDTTIA
jgi:hypothetical protein